MDKYKVLREYLAEDDSCEASGDQRANELIRALLAERDALVGALELISDTDPDEGTAWFHEIADRALAAYRKGGDI